MIAISTSLALPGREPVTLPPKRRGSRTPDSGLSGGPPGAPPAWPKHAIGSRCSSMSRDRRSMRCRPPVRRGSSPRMPTRLPRTRPSCTRGSRPRSRPSGRRSRRWLSGSLGKSASGLAFERPPLTRQVTSSTFFFRYGSTLNRSPRRGDALSRRSQPPGERPRRPDAHRNDVADVDREAEDARRDVGVVRVEERQLDIVAVGVRAADGALVDRDAIEVPPLRRRRGDDLGGLERVRRRVVERPVLGRDAEVPEVVVDAAQKISEAARPPSVLLLLAFF